MILNLMPFLLLFNSAFFPYLESFSKRFSNAIVASVPCSVYNRSDFLNIRISVFVKYGFFCLDIHYLSYKQSVKPYFKGMKEFALEDNRKLSYIRGSYKLTSYWSKTGCLELIFILSACDAEVIGFLYIIL